MEKIAICIAASLLSAGAISQTLEKGAVSITGGLGMQLQSQTQTINSSSIDYSIFINQVDASYYLVDNLAIGMRGTNQSTTAESSLGQSKSATNILVPNISYNLSVSETIALRLSIGYAFGNGYSESDNVVTSTYSQSGFEAKASLPIFDREYFSVDPFFVYRSSTVTDDSNSVYDLSDTIFGFSMSVYYDLIKK
jgi:hypothetical protein